MRNILIFPDGTEQHFMYPANREVEVGEKLQVILKDDIVHVLTISKIEKKEKDVYYYLDFS